MVCMTLSLKSGITEILTLQSCCVLSGHESAFFDDMGETGSCWETLRSSCELSDLKALYGTKEICEQTLKRGNHLPQGHRNSEEI